MAIDVTDDAIWAGAAAASVDVTVTLSAGATLAILFGGGWNAAGDTITYTSDLDGSADETHEFIGDGNLSGFGLWANPTVGSANVFTIGGFDTGDFPKAGIEGFSGVDVSGTLISSTNTAGSADPASISMTPAADDVFLANLSSGGTNDINTGTPIGGGPPADIRVGWLIGTGSSLTINLDAGNAGYAAGIIIPILSEAASMVSSLMSMGVGS